MRRLVLTHRRVVQDDHILIRLRIRFKADTGLSFNDNLVNLICEISAAEAHHDTSTIRVVHVDNDDENENPYSNTGVVEIAVPVNVCQPELGFPALIAIATYASVYSYVETYHLLDIDFPDEYLERFTGPRVGADGITAIHGGRRVLLGLILRPRFGTDLQQLSRYVRDHVTAGVDCILDDELTIPTQESFDRRVSTIRQAIDSAQRERDGDRQPTTYIANITSRSSLAQKLARQALANGANGVMLNPLLMSHDALQLLTEDPDYRGIVVTNHIGRSMISGGPQYRIAPTLLCKLARIAGADATYIQPFAGVIRNPERIAVEFEHVLTGPLARKCQRNTTLAVMSGGLRLGEMAANQRLYQGPLMLCMGNGYSTAWAAGIPTDVVTQCIRTSWDAARSEDPEHLKQQLMKFQGRSATHRRCLEMFNVDRLISASDLWARERR